MRPAPSRRRSEPCPRSRPHTLHRSPGQSSRRRPCPRGPPGPPGSRRRSGLPSSCSSSLPPRSADRSPRSPRSSRPCGRDDRRPTGSRARRRRSRARDSRRSAPPPGRGRSRGCARGCSSRKTPPSRWRPERPAPCWRPCTTRSRRRDDDPGAARAVGDEMRDPVREVRVVHGVRAVRTAVVDLGAVLAEMSRDALLEPVAAVVGAEGDLGRAGWSGARSEAGAPGSLRSDPSSTVTSATIAAAAARLRLRRNGAHRTAPAPAGAARPGTRRGRRRRRASSTRRSVPPACR